MHAARFEGALHWLSEWQAYGTVPKETVFLWLKRVSLRWKISHALTPPVWVCCVPWLSTCSLPTRCHNKGPLIIPFSWQHRLLAFWEILAHCPPSKLSRAGHPFFLSVPSSQSGLDRLPVEGGSECPVSCHSFWGYHLRQTCSCLQLLPDCLCDI